MTSEPNPEPDLKTVTIFTDGAAVPNPGAGGYGVVLRLGERLKELSGGFRLTTNNRMELMAVIVGLEALTQSCRVTLHSDSQYIVNAINTGAVFTWRSNGWARNPSGSKLAKNVDLWERLLESYEKHEVEMVWVKGHAGIADNERCDTLAMEALQSSELPPDPGYDESKVDEPENAAAPKRRTPKTKIVTEGQPCRKCGMPVVKRIPRKKKVKPNQRYYYAWYLSCPECSAMYMVEEAKREVSSDGTRE